MDLLKPGKCKQGLDREGQSKSGGFAKRGYNKSAIRQAGSIKLLELFLSSEGGKGRQGVGSSASP